jgi:dTMP kinase
MTMQFEMPQPYPGRLIIVEGIDGSGKSTQLLLLQKWLLSAGYRVFHTEWNSSALVNEAIRRGKKKNLLTPATFSILHATDFADRLSHLIVPPLKAGMIVLADRYVYTAFARDVVRGVHPLWVRNMYGFAVRPDIGFYFRVDAETSLRRILSARTKLKYHEAGMDLGIAGDITDSFRHFQGKVLEEYDRITGEYGLTVIDAGLPIKAQQSMVRKIVKESLKDYNPSPFLRKKENIYVE